MRLLYHKTTCDGNCQRKGRRGGKYAVEREVAADAGFQRRAKADDFAYTTAQVPRLRSKHWGPLESHEPFNPAVYDAAKTALISDRTFEAVPMP